MMLKHGLGINYMDGENRMRMQELQDVLWGTYDDAIERGMSDKDAREWAVNLFVQVIGKDEYAYKPKKEI